MLLRAASEALNSHRGVGKIVVVSNATYVVDSANSWLPKWQKRGFPDTRVQNEPAWRSLVVACAGLDVRWVWTNDATPEMKRCQQLAREQASRVHTATRPAPHLLSSPIANPSGQYPIPAATQNNESSQSFELVLLSDLFAWEC
jgi:ribonuclease HI